MARDTFEIYYHQNGRWSVHASFESAERELALAEAQKVDKTLGYPVRLVRETFYPETNTSEEVVSWQSAKAKTMGDPEGMFGGGDKGKPASKLQQKNKPKPPAPIQAPPPRRVEKPEPAPAAPPPAPKRRAKKTKSRGLTRKVVKVVVASLAISLLLVVTAGFIINNLQLVAPEDTAAVGAGIFVVSYVINALYFLGKEFDIKFGWRRRRKADKAAAADAAPHPSDMIRKMKVASIEAASNQHDVDVSATAQANIDDLRESIEQADAEDIADRSGADDFASAVHEEPEASVPELDEPKPAQPASEPPKAEKAPEPPPQPKAPEKKGARETAGASAGGE